MLSAIRNLGILKMVGEFPADFDSTAFISVDSFLSQREKAISAGNYAKLQFEPIKGDTIGIFSIDGERITFEEEKIGEDSWKYLFLKTAPNGAYISPTWKEVVNEKEKKLNKKLRETVDQFKRDFEGGNDTYWLRNVIKIFSSSDIEIPELDLEGNLIKKPFFEVVEWAKDNKKIKVFSVKIDGKYCAEIGELLDSALASKPDTIYQTNLAKSFNIPDIKCSLCGREERLFPNVLSGVGINIGNVDKPVFFPGVNTEESSKAFPICSPCAETLYVAKFHVFPSLIQNISGHSSLIIPHLIESNNFEEGLDIIKKALELLTNDISGAKQTERNILKDLSENKSIATLTFMMGEVGGQNVQNIRKVIIGVIPSRLSEISKSIEDVNKIYDNLETHHPWKQKYYPLNGNLRIINSVFGYPKYAKPNSKGGRKPFKTSSVDTLDLLSAVFLKREFSLKNILTEFSAKLSYDFLGTLSETDTKKSLYSIQNNIVNMYYLLLFLNQLEVVKIKSGSNYVAKYLENHEGLKPLNDFLSLEAKGLDTKDRQYTFLIGILFGKLVRIQMAKGVSVNALRWLKDLQLNEQDLMEIFVKTRSKLDEYSSPKSVWSDEMKGVAEAIAALGADISEWNLSRKEIPYYMCLGQSLSQYYLPSKTKENQSNNGNEGE